MPLVRRAGTGFTITGSVGSVALGTGAAEAAAGDHDHATTGVGATGARTTYRGGAALQRTAVGATPYAATAGDYLLGVTLAGAVTITLPENAPAGTVYVVKDERGTAASATITVERTGADTIDGQPAVAITTDYGAAAFYSDGANWFAL